MKKKQINILYIRYSGVWSKFTNKPFGDREGVEIPRNISTNCIMHLIVPGLSVSQNFHRSNVHIYSTPIIHKTGNIFCLICFNFLSFLKVIYLKVLNKIEFDIIHVFPETFLSGKLISLIYKRKIVTQYYSVKSIEIKKTLCIETKKSFLKHSIYKAFTYINGLALSDSNGFIVNSVEIQQYIVDNVKDKKIAVIGPGIDIKKFNPSIPINVFLRKKYKIDCDTICACYIGSIVKERGLETIITAMSYLKNENVKLFIIGDGNSLEDLKMFSDKNNSNDQVIFTGYLDQDKIPEIIKEMDICISYIKRDTYDNSPPLKTLEYLAMGKPVIATITNAHLSLLQHGENSLLVADGDPYVLSESLMELIKNEALSTKIAKEGPSIALQNTWVNKSALYDSFYKELHER